jgi:uncharacterized damage-inducible protein DinB
MDVDDLVVLFDYMYWVNRRLLERAGQLSPEGFAAPTTVTTRGLRTTLVHELDVEWSWRLNLQGRVSDDDAELEPDQFPDVSSLADRWRQDEAEMREWPSSLTSEQLAADVPTTFTREVRPLWQFLLHMTTHAAQQQADAATLLSLAGQSPGELSFLEYLAAKGGRRELTF